MVMVQKVVGVMLIKVHVIIYSPYGNTPRKAEQIN